MILYLEIEKTSFGFSLNEEICRLKVQFISDLFEKLNSLNLSLQGPSENIVKSTSKLKSFEEKLTLWKSEISKGNFDCFPGVSMNLSRKKNANEIISTTSLKNFFPSLSVDKYEWLINPIVNYKTPNWTNNRQRTAY